MCQIIFLTDFFIQKIFSDLIMKQNGHLSQKDSLDLHKNGFNPLFLGCFFFIYTYPSKQTHVYAE